MQYMLLIHEMPADFARRDQVGDDNAYLGAWRAYHKAVVEAGIYVAGSPLEAPETSTTVRHREGKRHVQDGPYASSKEHLGGFTVLELPSLDAALEWAARCPAASYGSVEVRPVALEFLRRVASEDKRE